MVEAAALALKAGIDIDMMANAYHDGLPAALERGLVTMDDIDTSVRRVLLLKEQLGLFDEPYRRGVTESATVLAARRQLAREAATRSIVLLKNDNAALPLADGRLAVIGPLADAPAEMRGCWPAAGLAGDCISLLAGLRFALPHRSIRYAPGVDIESTDESRIAEAAGSVRRCRHDPAVPGRIRRHERRSVQPRPSRPAGPAKRLGRSRTGARPGQARHRRAVFRPPVDRHRSDRARRRRAGGLGAGLRGRKRLGGPLDRPRLSVRPHAHELAARAGPDSRSSLASARRDGPPIPTITTPANISTKKTSRSFPSVMD